MILSSSFKSSAGLPTIWILHCSSSPASAECLSSIDLKILLGVFGCNASENVESSRKVSESMRILSDIH